MKISGLFLVVCYAALMLFALWKQNSKTASSADSASRLDDAPSAGSSNKLPTDGTSATGSSNKLPADGTSPASGMSSIISSACIAAGCLLLLAYSLLYMALDRSRMSLLIAGMLGISAGTLLNGLRLKNLHIRHHIIRLIIEAAIVAICWISVHGT